MAETGYVEVEGARLYYETAGTGAALVMLHAGIADCSMWDPQFEAFQDRYQVIRYDERAFGKSETVERVPFSNRADLRAILDTLGIKEAILMGCSRGGQIALDATLESPERVRALIMVCCGPGDYDYGDINSPEEKVLYAELGAAQNDEEWTNVNVRLCVDGVLRGGQAPEAVREKVRAMCLHLASHFTDPGEVIALDPPSGGRLNEIHVPTLAIIGEFDTHYAHAGVDLFASQTAGTHKVIIRSAAHVPNMEHPDEFNSIIREFLNGLPT